MKKVDDKLFESHLKLQMAICGEEERLQLVGRKSEDA